MSKVERSTDRWKGLIQVAVAVMAVGVVLTIGGSLKGSPGIERFGEVMAFGGFCLFLVARIKFAQRGQSGNR